MNQCSAGIYYFFIFSQFLSYKLSICLPFTTDRSGSPTPRNSPRESGRHQQRGDHTRSSAHSTLTRHQISVLRSAQAAAQAQAQQSTITQPPAFEPRMVYPVLRKSGDLGVRLVGGNAVGIFIHSVDPDSAAYHVGK